LSAADLLCKPRSQTERKRSFENVGQFIKGNFVCPTGAPDSTNMLMLCTETWDVMCVNKAWLNKAKPADYDRVRGTVIIQEKMYVIFHVDYEPPPG